MSARPSGVFAYFLPPGIQWNQHHHFLFDPAFKHTDSYQATLREVAALNPEEILGNVLLCYKTEKMMMHPHGNPYREIRSVNFMHPEISAERFLQVIKCCNPSENRSLESVMRCWNQAAPGNLSEFNLDVARKEDLDPRVRENLDRYYPPQG